MCNFLKSAATIELKAKALASATLVPNKRGPDIKVNSISSEQAQLSFK